MVVFREHTLPTCFTSLSKYIVTVYRKTGHGDHQLCSLSAYVAVSFCAGFL